MAEENGGQKEATEFGITLPKVVKKASLFQMAAANEGERGIHIMDATIDKAPMNVPVMFLGKSKSRSDIKGIISASYDEFGMIYVQCHNVCSTVFLVAEGIPGIYDHVNEAIPPVLINGKVFVLYRAYNSGWCISNDGSFHPLGDDKLESVVKNLPVYNERYKLEFDEQGIFKVRQCIAEYQNPNLEHPFYKWIECVGEEKDFLSIPVEGIDFKNERNNCKSISIHVKDGNLWVTRCYF